MIYAERCKQWQGVDMYLTVDQKQTYVYLGKADSQARFDTSKPTIVFIHGAQLDHSCWTLQSRWFAHHGFNTFAMDLPGHGKSSGPAIESVEDMSAWVLQLIHALGVSKPILVGHSMGSLIALQTAVCAKELIHSMVLIGSSAPMPVSDALLNAAMQDEPKAIAMVNQFSHSNQGQIGRSEVPGMWLLGVNERLMEQQNKGVFFNDLSACNRYLPNTELLQLINIPVYLLCGSEDKMTPLKSSKRLASLIPGAKLRVIQGAGHALMSEAPNAVIDNLKEFLSDKI